MADEKGTALTRTHLWRAFPAVFVEIPLHSSTERIKEDPPQLGTGQGELDPLAR